MFVLHPLALNKGYSNKLIPKEQTHPIVGTFPPSMRIRCAYWSKVTPLKPNPLKVEVFTLKQAVAHDKIMPLTYAQGMVEPQMFAFDTYGKYDLPYAVIVDNEEPIHLSGNTLIWYENKMNSIRQLVDKLNGAESFVSCVGNIPPKDSRPTMINRKIRILRRQRPYVEDAFIVGLWDQPQRVAHVQGKLITSSGLILG